ncbi:LysR family transcriptional regulator [Acinetobacter populi]|uniref:LysR family transcriptional regulator n=1 Tax=Acinetobacter populi TaxID=1582270 RepID=A0A1Z9Z0Y9_9GAMM|nr:LysR family transcriptional regulator [Acinetobacter populi]OUY08120.1 LysR family transcriptional regulator [Acinetobacter populi]
MNNIHNLMSKNSNLDLPQFYRIDANLYPLFIAIFEQQSISKAAHLLCISQSAVSHALQRLRLQLHDDLFIRTGNKMLPTAFAQQIYLPIKQALISLQNISLQQQSFDPKTLQQLKIAVHDEIEPLIFPKLIAHFQQFNPEIQFLSSKLDRKNMRADLASQQIDFVIDLAQHNDEKLQFQCLVEDFFVVCTAQQQMNKEIYLSAPHIGVSSRRTGQLVEDIYLHRQQQLQQKQSRQIFLRCQHYATALQVLTQHPTAILTIPQSILKHLHYDQSLRIFELPIELPHIRMGMFWHQDLQDNPRHNFLRQEILKIFC